MMLADADSETPRRCPWIGTTRWLPAGCGVLERSIAVGVLERERESHGFGEHLLDS